MNEINLKAAEQTAQAIKEDPSLKMRNWKATVQWKKGVQNVVKIRDFDSVMMDEPETLGGTDEAPNPVEMLIGSVASCFAITFEVMASQKGVKLNEVTVNIEADLNAAVFLGLEEGYGGIIDPKLYLKATTSASESEVKAIAEEALGKSPVLASLKPEIKLNIQ